MAITYEWKVTGIKVKNEGDFSNVVVQTYWTKTGTDDNGNSGVFNGATPLKLSSNTDNFIEFSNLTEEDILSWIIPVVDENHVNGRIQLQIDEKTSPVVEASLPWANTASE